MQRRSLERGQAMSEYMVLYPIAIGVIIAASAIASFLITSFQRTVDVFQPQGAVCEENAPERSGPMVAQMGDHTIEVTAIVYNETDDTTTVTYSVTSGPKPSISHWVLGIPEDVAANIISASEKYEDWALDPTTDLEGTKFDTGYEDTGSEAEADAGSEEEADTGGNNGKGKDKDKGKIVEIVFEGKAPLMMQTTDNDGLYRDVTLLFSGQYDFGEAAVTVKAGGNVHESIILAPLAPYVSNCDTGADG